MAREIDQTDMAAVTRWQRGWFAGYRGERRPAQPDAADGWRAGCERRASAARDGEYRRSLPTDGRLIRPAIARAAWLAAVAGLAALLLLPILLSPVMRY